MIIASNNDIICLPADSKKRKRAVSVSAVNNHMKVYYHKLEQMSFSFRKFYNINNMSFNKVIIQCIEYALENIDTNFEKNRE